MARTVTDMEFTRESIAEILRRTGDRQLADEAVRSLPELLDEDELLRFSNRHHVNLDMLINEMGGSP